MRFEEKTVKENVVFKGRILTLKDDEVLLPNGNSGKREIVEHSGGSAVLCEKDGKILMVKQFRYAYKEELWEIPAGKVNYGEDPLLTAYRELEEEGGVTAKEMELMFTMYPSPGYSAEKIRIYRAKEIAAGKAHLDEDEFLTAEWIDKTALKEMINNGEIKDGKTLVALLAVL